MTLSATVRALRDLALEAGAIKRAVLNRYPKAVCVCVQSAHYEYFEITLPFALGVIRLHGRTEKDAWASALEFINRSA